MTGSPADDRLLTILENYYLFLEALLERPPHRRGGIKKEIHGLFVRVFIYDIVRPLLQLHQALRSGFQCF